MKNKFLRKGLIIIAIITLIIVVMFNLSYGWIYVKVNGNTYVANSTEINESDYSESIDEKIGNISSKTISFFKPIKNRASNGFPEGTEIYSSNYPNVIFIKYNEKFYELCNIDNDTWGNGVKVKIKNGNVTPY